jgi:hypothetical protein
VEVAVQLLLKAFALAAATLGKTHPTYALIAKGNLSSTTTTAHSLHHLICSMIGSIWMTTHLLALNSGVCSLCCCVVWCVCDVL